MQFRSITRRGLSALATSALAAGALTVPVALMAAPAQAASGPISYTCDLTMTGGFATYGGQRQATLTFDTDAADEATVGTSVTPTLTATLTFASAYSDLFVGSPVNRIGGSLTAATDTEGTAGTAPIAFTQWDRGGGTGTPISSISMTGTGSWGTVSAAQAGGIDLGVGTLTGTLYMGTTFSPNNTQIPTVCTPNGAATSTVDTITAVPAPIAKDLSLSCTFGDNEFAYETDLDLTAQAKKNGKILVTANLESMPNTAPDFINLTDQKFVATLDTDLGDLVGSHQGNFQGGTPVAIPAMSGLFTGSGSTQAVTVEDFTLAVGAAATIPCTLDAPKTFTVDVAPKTQVCVNAETALPVAQGNLTAATNAAAAESANVATATATAASATKAASKAKSSASKAAKTLKKATKAVKKAKSKAKKAKAKKALTKAKKANTKAKQALTKANGQVKTANAQLTAAQGKSAAANSAVASATSALTAAQNALNNC